MKFFHLEFFNALCQLCNYQTVVTEKQISGTLTSPLPLYGQDFANWDENHFTEFSFLTYVLVEKANKES